MRKSFCAISIFGLLLLSFNGFCQQFNPTFHKVKSEASEALYKVKSGEYNKAVQKSSDDKKKSDMMKKEKIKADADVDATKQELEKIKQEKSRDWDVYISAMEASRELNEKAGIAKKAITSSPQKVGKGQKKILFNEYGNPITKELRDAAAASAFSVDSAKKAENSIKKKIEELTQLEKLKEDSLKQKQDHATNISAAVEAFSEDTKNSTAAVDSASKTMDSLDKTTSVAPRVIFYGSTALSGQSTDDLTKSITGSGQLLISANITDRFNIHIGANLLNVNPNKVKKDSVDFNSLMFPETGNFGFLFNGSYKLVCKKEFAFIPFYEFSYRKVYIDSPQIGFKIYNHTIGAGIEWRPDFGKDDNFGINISPYYHWFNIPVEDVKNFTSFVNDSLFAPAAVANNNVLIKSIGIKIIVQYNTFVFFADFRKNFHTDQLSNGDPFKGGAVNIGFQTLLKIKSLP